VVLPARDDEGSATHLSWCLLMPERRVGASGRVVSGPLSVEYIPMVLSAMPAHRACRALTDCRHWVTMRSL